MPSCDNVCGKLLSCKLHSCKEICHDSDCKPCNETIKTGCRCGRTTKRMTCAESQELVARTGSTEVICKRTCSAGLSRGKHQCKVVCCAERKNRNAEVHICTEVCRNMLNT
eukprot:UN13544